MVTNHLRRWGPILQVTTGCHAHPSSQVVRNISSWLVLSWSHLTPWPNICRLVSRQPPWDFMVRQTWGWGHPCMVYLPTFTIFYHLKQPNVGKYTIHGWYGYNKWGNCFFFTLFTQKELWAPLFPTWPIWSIL